MKTDHADRAAFSGMEAAALAELADRTLIGRLWQRDAGIFGLSADATRTVSAHLGWLFRTSPGHAAIDELVTVAKVAERHMLTRVLVVGDPAVCAWVEVVGRHLRQRRGAVVSTLGSSHPEAVAAACAQLRGKDALLVLVTDGGIAAHDPAASTWPTLRAALADDGRVALLALGCADDADHGHADRVAAALGLRPSGLRLCSALPAGVAPRFATGSAVGLLTAALSGVNVRASLERIEDLAAELRESDVAGHPAAPLAAWLAAVLGSGHRHLHVAVGRDIRAFGPWIAALLQDAGLVGPDGAPLTVVSGPLPTRGPAASLPCTAVVAISTFAAPDDAAVDAAEDAGVPTWRMVLPEPMDLWAEALRWQAAVALLGALRGIDTLSGADTRSRPASVARDGASAAARVADAHLGRLVEADAWLRPRVAALGAERCVSIRCALAPTEAQRDRALALQTHLQEQTAAVVSVGFGIGPPGDDAASTLRVWIVDEAGQGEADAWLARRAAPDLLLALDPAAAARQPTTTA